MKLDLEGRIWFRTGSSLVKDVEPNDKDIVVLIDDPLEYAQLLIDVVGLNAVQANLDHESVGDDDRFITFRDEDINYICTLDLELFYRFRAFSGALSHLQLKDREARVELSKACLYWCCTDTEEDLHESA